MTRITAIANQKGAMGLAVTRIIAIANQKGLWDLP